MGVLSYLWAFVSYLRDAIAFTVFRIPVETSKVDELVVYPVKGCRGVSVQRARIKSTGGVPVDLSSFYFDRHWVIVSESGRSFTNQKTRAELALVGVALPTEAFLGELTSLPKDACLELSTGGKAPLQVPLITAPGNADARPLVDCSVWEWQGKALDEGDEAADWLSEHLGSKCRLMCYAGPLGQADAGSNEARRLENERFKPFAGRYEMTFADRFPFLLASQASLDDLNARLPSKVPMDRFRPNIIVTGDRPWGEDAWKAFKITNSDGTVRFRAAMPCDRCKVTTTDQGTAEVDADRQPLATLEDIRSLKVLGWTGPTFHAKSAFFGWLTIAEAPGIIAVGDRLQVTRWRSTFRA